MAILTIFKHINMDNADFSFVSAPILTATHIQLVGGSFIQNYYGSFTYNASGDVAGGTVTSADFSDNAGKILTLSGSTYNVITIKNYILSFNATGLLNYLFAGNDVINGSVSADILNSYAGNDTLNGNGGNDTLRGYGGNDLLNGGIGADLMIGGDGSDIYVVDNALDQVTETNANTSLGGIDTVSSYLFNYTLTANVEIGRIAYAGPANITGNSLNNVLYAGVGNNLINGGAGIDNLSYSFATTTAANGIQLNLTIVNASGQTVVSGISGTDLIKNIENVTGSNYNDSLIGNNGNNVLNGGLGNDLLIGGLGNDVLVGGAGKDFFRFNTALNSITNKDIIADFSVVDDAFQLENAVFTKLVTVGLLAAGIFRASTTGAAADGNDFILYNTASGTLSYDADGNGAVAAIQIATVGTISHPALTAADFIVI